MSSAAARFIGKKVVGRIANKKANGKQNGGQNNKKNGVGAPEKETEFYMKPDRRTGRPKKTRKDVDYFVSQGISAHDAKILVSIKSRARKLDNGIDLGFTRCGYSSIIGLVPGIGDFADGGLAFTLVILKAAKVDSAPGKNKELVLMCARAGVRTILGLTPILGDIGITFYRANTKNAEALEKWLLQNVGKGPLPQEKIVQMEAQDMSSASSRDHSLPVSRDHSRTRIPLGQTRPAQKASVANNGMTSADAATIPHDPPPRYVNAQDIARTSGTSTQQSGQTSGVTQRHGLFSRKNTAAAATPTDPTVPMQPTRSQRDFR